MKATPPHKSNGWWQFTWYDTSGRRRTTKLGKVADLSKSAALRARDRALRQIEQHEPIAGRVPTLGEWIEQYATMRESAVSEGTLALDADTARYLLDHFPASVRVDRITRHGAERWRVHLVDAGLKEATIARHVRCARTMFNRLVRDEIVRVNPFLSLSAPNIAKLKPDLRGEWIDRLIEASPDAAWRAAWGLAGWAGLRRSEIMALTWADVLFDQHRINVPPAKTAPRQTLMEPQLADLLAECQTVTESELVAPITGDLYRTQVRIIKRAGLKPWPQPFHAWRSWRSGTWKAKHPAWIVDLWLGHSASVAAKNYNNTVPESAYGPSEVERLRARIAELERESEKKPKKLVCSDP